MKKLILTLALAALSLTLCACGSESGLVPENIENSQASPAETESIEQGTADVVITDPPKSNTSAFSMTGAQLGETLNGSWVNQMDYTEKLRFNSDLTFTHFKGGDKHEGTAVLTEDNGWLSLEYVDGFAPTRNYIWVDHPANVNANTWYVNGGTFAYGGKTFIRDLEI